MAATGQPLPLEGIKVVELATMIAVPFATYQLVCQGASVIKVEPVRGGDELRRYGSQKNGMSGWFANANAGKRSIALDLADDDARAVLWELIESADVFIEGFRPGVVDRLGFGWDECRPRNPRLVHVSSSGFGPDGPYADKPTYDPVIQAMAGWAGGQQVDGAPTLIRNMVADKVAAMTTAQAVTAALVGRATTGEGRHVQMSMLESNLAFNWNDVMMHATLLDDDAVHMPNILGSYRLFEAKDGWVSITAGTDAQWAGMCNALGRPDLANSERFATAADRAANLPDWYAEMEAMVAGHTVAETLELGTAHDVPCAPVVDPADVAANEQVAAVGAVAEIDHPVIGRMRTPQTGARFGDVRDLSPAPTHGEHTGEVLAELGRSADAIAAMRERGAIR